METNTVTNSWVYYSFILVIAFLWLLPIHSDCNVILTDNGYKKSKNLMVISFLLIGFITFWAAIRNGVADTATYIYGYDEMTDPQTSFIDIFKGNDKAPLFSVFKLALKKLGFDYHVYLAAIAIISGICIAYGIGAYTENVFLSAFIFVASTNCMWLFNGIRQFLVVSIIFASTRLIAEKKLFKFLLLVFILYLIHNSCIIMIPIYFILNFKPWSRQIGLCVVATMAIVFLFPKQFIELLDEGFEEYHIMQHMEEDDGVNILRVLVAAVPSVLAFIYRENINEYNNKYVNLWINASVITVGLYAVGVVSSGVFVGRLPIYTEIYNVLLLPFLLKRIIPPDTQKILYIACLGFFMLFFYLMQQNAYYTTDLFNSMNLVTG